MTGMKDGADMVLNVKEVLIAERIREAQKMAITHALYGDLLAELMFLRQGF